MKKPKVLIVDDEAQMRMLLRIHLQDSYQLLEASNGYEAIELVEKEPVDIVLLDIMMPNLDGKQVCKKIRTFNKDIPIILLTALNESKDKVEGLTIGADDYVVKPFDPEELAARIHVQLRRVPAPSTEGSILSINELIIKPESREVLVSNIPLKLTPKEFDLLYLLASNQNWVYTREQLLDKVWGLNDIVDIRTVDSHVRYVRDKLKKAGLQVQPIKTIWGVGYKFSSGDSE
ncbi:response regulator transcription factor [Aquibacillus koreensis]|uniref:Heme response regulator HssR n=1 Tax=Aquibacillus koreensis TaxID=279446 RepID=A0A9X4AJC6_9BACI|nr:response regulator transcription factor [Aquibacillus koreensis]MCT2535747.1 response regulator transcription factor [Aquibacillus koreensis]MDC3420203.1 response regulator transcription factor [Aquibacillus koreensis]